MTTLFDPTTQTPAAGVHVGVAPAAGTTLLDRWISGVAKPKGSLRHVGRGRLVEQVAGSADWRTNVREAAREHVRCCADPTCGRLRDGYPHTGAVEVRLRLFFDKPKSAPKRRAILPVTRSTGDADKLARNALDALVDAGVLKDDSQVVTLVVHKRYCETGSAPGAHLSVYVVSAVDGAGVAG